MNRVMQMVTPGGRTVKSHFVITRNNGDVIFQSYDSAIVMIDSTGVVHLSEDWDYSTTTGKYRNMFLGETKIETMQKIQQGEYLMDLNPDGELITVGGNNNE